MKVQASIQLLLFVVLYLFSTEGFASNYNISPEEASSIGVDAYIYGYPLISMEITRKIMTNVESPNETKAPMGRFAHTRKYPKASFKHHRAPDTDILPSNAWVNLKNEPYILHVPEVGSRHYFLPLMNAWSEMFSSITPRMNGGHACDYALTGPEWKGSLPSNLTEIKSPTNVVWITGRTCCNGSAEDYKAVHVIQNLYSLIPLSAYQQNIIYTPPRGVIDPSLNMKETVHEQIEAMDVESYFNLLTLLMKDNPPGPEDRSILKNMARIGLMPGKSFSLESLSPATALAMQKVPQAALEKIVQRAGDRGLSVNGWRVLPYASEVEDYMQRAVQIYMGIRAALPEDALFAFTAHDLEGNPLTGSHAYIIHFTKEQIPPVHSFWSLAAYNENYQLTPNSLNRYTIHSEDLLKYNRDGSLDIYVQHATPGPNKASNWLPVSEGKFVLMFRLYRPKEEILKGTWTAPSVIKDLF